jgi:hypothetical protein
MPGVDVSIRQYHLRLRVGCDQLGSKAGGGNICHGLCYKSVLRLQRGLNDTQT